MLNNSDLKCCGNCFWYTCSISMDCQKCEYIDTCNDYLVCKYMWCRCSKYGHTAKGSNSPCKDWKF